LATRYTLGPFAAEPPLSGYGELSRSQGRPYIALDAALVEGMNWSFVAPAGLTAPLTAVVHGFMASAASGAVVLAALVEAITPLDAVDLNTASSFDTANTSAATTVPATAGYSFTVSIPLTNADGMAAGDLVRLQIQRVATDSGDTALGDLRVTCVEFKDAA
jgi:hypothetical protein